MKIYIAAVYNTAFDRNSVHYEGLSEKQRAPRLRASILESFHYCKRQVMTDRIRADGERVFLDSGAFSAHFSDAEIDINDYCAYLWQNQDIIEVASVLDAINNPLKSWENQRHMEQQGLRPLPCYHWGEDERYLEWYVANYDYITIGGMVPISTKNLRPWLDRIWSKHLTDKEGKPRVKVHGFGMTSLSLMERYPWYSVDSSRWLQAARFGNILIPSNEQLIGISQDAPHRKTKGQHFDNLAPIQKDAIAEEIDSYGFGITILRTNTYARRMFNILAFQAIEAKINQDPDPRFIQPHNTLF